jgi:hypothetical protein
MKIGDFYLRKNIEEFAVFPKDASVPGLVPTRKVKHTI